MTSAPATIGVLGGPTTTPVWQRLAVSRGDAIPFPGRFERHRDVAQAGSAPALGAGGREFKSLRPDQRGGCRPFPRRSRSHRDERNDRLPSAPLAGVAQWLEPLPSKQDMRVRFSSPAPPQDSGVFSPPASPQRPPVPTLSSRFCHGSRRRRSSRGRPSGSPARPRWTAPHVGRASLRPASCARDAP